MEFLKLKYIIFICLFTTSGAYAQNISLYGGSASNFSIGNATIANSNEMSAINNQAGILSVEKWGFQAGAMNLFGLNSLNIISASGIYKFNANNAVSLSIRHLGDNDLRNQIIGFAYARRLMKNWSISLQADVLSFQAPGFGSRFIPTVEIGSIYEVNDKVNIGFHVFNPFGQALTEQEDISAIIRAGVSYELSDKVSLLAEVEKDIIFPFRIKAGIIYMPVEKLSIRTGFNTQEAQFAFGLSYRFGNYSIHGAANVHPSLGLSSGGEISYKN